MEQNRVSKPGQVLGSGFQVFQFRLGTSLTRVRVTRRSPHCEQAAQLEEIPVHAGNNQLPQDLKERSAQGCEFYIHTAYHGNSRLDYGTLTADIPMTFLLRPVRAQSSSKDVVNRKTWDLMKDQCSHVKRAGNRTWPCDDPVDKLSHTPCVRSPTCIPGSSQKAPWQFAWSALKCQMELLVKTRPW